MNPTCSTAAVDRAVVLIGLCNSVPLYMVRRGREIGYHSSLLLGLVAPLYMSRRDEKKWIHSAVGSASDFDEYIFSGGRRFEPGWILSFCLRRLWVVRSFTTSFCCCSTFSSCRQYVRSFHSFFHRSSSIHFFAGVPERPRTALIGGNSSSPND